MSFLPLDQPAHVFGLLFFVILVAPLLAERARVPGLIGLLLAGTLIGPNGLGLLQRSGAVETLGGAGLLYLMFIGGLDLDLNGLRRDVRDSVVFGALTLVIPGIIHVAVAAAFGLGLAATVMVSSAFTSHTLLSYPLVQRFGIARNRAIITTLGATLLCNVGALLMLAVAAAAGTGESSLRFWIGFPAGLVLFLAVTLWGLPRLTRWVFRGVGQDRAVRLTFVLMALFGISAAADLVRIEPIVGAFLAGLAVNRFVGEGTLVRERLDVLGTTVFIPLFLIATGMLIDPIGVATDPATLAMGLVFSAATVTAKFLAAWPAAHWLGFDRAELGMMVSLSTGQAAGALAAIVVAERLELVEPTVVNAAVMVILVTALVASVLGQRFAPLVTVPERRVAPIGQRIVVPVANPRTAGPLVALAGSIAGPDHGSVIAVNVLNFEASAGQVEEHRTLTAEAERGALRIGAEASSLVRIDATPTAGVLHTVVEHGATCVLIGWKGYANQREDLFGSVVDAIVARSTVPVLVAHPGADEPLQRVIVSLTRHDDFTPAGERALALAVDVAVRIATQAQVPLLIVTDEDAAVVREHLPAAWTDRAAVVHDPRPQTTALQAHTTDGDVVLMGVPPTLGRLGQRAVRVGRAIPHRTLILTVPR